nr:MAG TPA: hypothetical protein [Caudoviricetes sp.]
MKISKSSTSSYTRIRFGKNQGRGNFLALFLCRLKNID